MAPVSLWSHDAILTLSSQPPLRHASTIFQHQTPPSTPSFPLKPSRSLPTHGHPHLFSPKLTERIFTMSERRSANPPPFPNFDLPRLLAESCKSHQFVGPKQAAASHPPHGNLHHEMTCVRRIHIQRPHVQLARSLGKKQQHFHLPLLHLLVSLFIQNHIEDRSLKHGLHL